jgi:putative nucleotidyltransferase with HDIG domain
MTPRKLLNSAYIHQNIPANELSTLLTVSSALATSLDLSMVLQTAIDSAVEVLRLDTGAIYILEADQLYLGATTPALSQDLLWMRLQAESIHQHPNLKKALALGQPISITDASTAELSPAESLIREARHLRTILYIPLLLEKKATGALILGTTGQTRTFTDHEMDLCRVLSYQITLSVANAKLFKSAQDLNMALVRSYDAMLLGWSLALEMRDQETKGHTLRVTTLTEDLARKMGVSAEDLTHIRRGALLHDIGKMSVSDMILNKAGPLTEDEWAVMKKHPEYAYQFLMKIEYLTPALDIPYSHHEKWDGSGYPRGLKGEEIPFAARIFAVPDVYDALTSDRPYRKAWDKDLALGYIEEQAGKQFDPRVVQVFLSEVVKRTTPR